ncbi:hypothetical protein SAMN06295987_1011162 [Novosphingobium mathurense]|uniref:Glycosyltransferase RgtA/B/C/D-like domain-containing protein n=1 Tax=Novosphingobium mathurense TaxID=428990 RepID=A0A1U6H359_9SPHN|nr:hypothetical protein SAMN06295987_1011162 [Novosphingobium mathurense]
MPLQGNSQSTGKTAGLPWPALAEWALVLAPAILLALLLSRKVWDVDIFWQLKLGEMILARHGPIAREPFAASHIGDSLPALAWLGQAVMAKVRLLGGWDALRVFDALCWAGGFWAVALACRCKGAAPGAVLVALCLSVVAALATASIRPQSFSVLCFGLLLALLRLELRPWLTVALATPLLVLWQNLHPSVSVAAGALGVYAAAGWVTWRLEDGKRPPVAETVLIPLAVLAMFATPDGGSILALSARNAQASLDIGVSEWLPMWRPANWLDSLPILYTAALTLWFVLRGRQRVDLRELAVAVALFVMTLVTIRFVLFWAVALVPLLSRVVSSPRPAAMRVPRWSAVLALALVALFGPQLLPTRFDKSLPMAAIERLRRENVRGVIYADFPYGGPIIDAGYPQWRVAFDGRYYRYTPEEWHFNGKVEAGKVGLEAIERKWSVAAFLLKVSHNTPLARELSRAPGWRRIWNRDGIVVYVPAERLRSSR